MNEPQHTLEIGPDTVSALDNVCGENDMRFEEETGMNGKVIPLIVLDVEKELEEASKMVETNLGAPNEMNSTSVISNVESEREKGVFILHIIGSSMSIQNSQIVTTEDHYSPARAFYISPFPSTSASSPPPSMIPSAKPRAQDPFTSPKVTPRCQANRSHRQKLPEHRNQGGEVIQPQGGTRPTRVTQHKQGNVWDPPELLEDVNAMQTKCSRHIHNIGIKGEKWDKTKMGMRSLKLP